MQKIREVTNLPDEYSSMSQTYQKIHETSKHPQHNQKVEVNVTEQSVDLQKKESCSTENNDTQYLSTGNKKSKTLLHWIRGTTNRKTGQMQNSQPITETVKNLPSLDNLDSLDLSSSNLDKKKNSKKMFDKLTKKIRSKKIAAKA